MSTRQGHHLKSVQNGSIFIGFSLLHVAKLTENTEHWDEVLCVCRLPYN